MPSSAPDDTMTDKPSENLLSDALREMLKNLDIKDVTPEVIISRFSKSGGIDRVRIAIEHRMKNFLESHKLHTVSASEEYLNEVLSKGDEMLHPQKLMQKTQDVVLATVKDRIGKDIDSVTEQGKAGWFLECVREELFNAIKSNEKVAKVEEEPLPTKPVVDGAKAILSNLTRTAVRPRQMNHRHESVRLDLSKDRHANGHVEDAGNHTMIQNEKQAGVKGNDVRKETPSVNRQKEMKTEADAEMNRKEAKVALKSPKHKVNTQSPQRMDHASPDHLLTSFGGKTKAMPSDNNVVPKSEDKTNQPTEEDVDYEALAERMLLGEGVRSDEEIDVEKKPDNVPMLIESSKAKSQNDLKDNGEPEDPSHPKNRNSFKHTSQLGATKASSASGKGLQGLPKDSVTQPLTLEKHPDHSGSEASKVPAPSKVENAGADHEGSTSKTLQASKLKVTESPRSGDIRQNAGDIRQNADDATTPFRERPIDEKSGKNDRHSTSDKMSIVQEAVHLTCDAKMAEGEVVEGKKTKTALDVNHDVKQNKECQSHQNEAKLTLRPVPESKEALNTAKESAKTGPGSSVVDGRKETTTKGTAEAKKRVKSLGDNEHKSEALRGHAASTSRRSSRRASLKDSLLRQGLSVDSIEVAEEQPGSQLISTTKKGKASKARTARKNEERTSELRTARKKGKKEVDKKPSDISVKKRKRNHASKDVTQEAGQSAERPDPAVENWPRGYGVTRSCVPDDYSEQQKVLHALEMLLKQECAEPFSEPVDTTENGLEMYTNVIKNPMDLGEICKRLQNSSAGCGYYASVTEILQDVDLVWWNCKEYNGQFDPIVAACEQTQQELSFLLEQHGIAVQKGPQKRRRVSRGRPRAPESPEQEPDLGDNDGRLVGKSVLIFTELKKRKKEWFRVDVKSYDKKTKSYSLFWEETGKTTKKATFGQDKVFPVYRVDR